MSIACIRVLGEASRRFLRGRRFARSTPLGLMTVGKRVCRKAVSQLLRCPYG